MSRRKGSRNEPRHVPGYKTVKEACELLNLSNNTVRKLMKQGVLESTVLVGIRPKNQLDFERGTLYIDEDNINACLNNRDLLKQVDDLVTNKYKYKKIDNKLKNKILEKGFRTIKQAADELNLTDGAIRNAIKDGRLKSQRITKDGKAQIFISEEAFEEFVNKIYSVKNKKNYKKHKDCSCNVCKYYLNKCIRCKIPTMSFSLMDGFPVCSFDAVQEKINYYMRVFPDTDNKSIVVNYHNCSHKFLTTLEFGQIDECPICNKLTEEDYFYNYHGEV